MLKMFKMIKLSETYDENEAKIKKCDKDINPEKLLLIVTFLSNHCLVLNLHPLEPIT